MYIGTNKTTTMVISNMLLCLTALSMLAIQAAAQGPGGGCPEPYGVQTYPDDKYCDKFYLVC